MVSAERSRPAVASLAGGIVALLLALVSTIAQRHPGQALGPVVAITPNEVTANGFVGYVRDVELSGRGETAGVRDDEVSDVGFVHFDDGDHEPMVEGQGIGVSGDGCTAVQVDGGNGLVLRVIRRCAGTEAVVAELSRSVWEVEVSVSFDGRFAALSYGFTDFGDDVGDTAVTWLDTTTGATADMPPLGSLRPWSSEFGVDIDDSGRFVVAPISDGRTMAVATWDTATGAVTNVAPVTAGRFAGMPSISGDGAWVSFASNQPRSLGETGGGPWVYVVPRGGGAARLVSPAAGIGYFSSLSSDGTQVAFSVSNGFVPAPTTTTQPPIILLRSPTADRPTMQGTVGCPNPLFVGMFEFETRCPPARIDVAYSATPGLVGAFQTETVSRAANGAIRGAHRKPELSGNGRWVAWLSDDGDALIGADQDLAGMRHAFMRRRDPGLVVDSLAFPSISVNTTIDATTTVRNTGRTSVWIEEITPSPGVFTHVGGTCAFGMSLGPGATCTVTIRYSPGATTGPSSGTLRVGEVGYDRVFATGAVTGSAVAPPVLGQPTTTTSTTLPPRTVTTTTTTTTQPGTPTTRPGSATLSATPNPVEFGSVAVGFASDPQNVTVTNNGSAGGLIQTSLGGAHPDDYWVRTNGCSDTTLEVGGQCQIEVLLIPRGGGIRTATLTIRSGASVVNVTLSGNGTFQPRLAPMPATVTKHGISTIYGQGFPPGETFTVTVLETGLKLQGTSDATGLFRTFLPASGNLVLGAYTLHVDGVANSFGDVESTLLVALGTFRPQGEGGPAFGNSNLIVARGG
jgi:hypothetical protein